MSSGADQRALHEVVAKRFIGHGPESGGSSGACGCTWSWSGSRVVAGRLGDAPSWATRPSWTHHGPLISGSSGPSSWATSSTVVPPSTRVAQRLGEGLLAGRVDPGRSARRGPAARARRPAPGRSGRAAAGRRTGRRPAVAGPVGQARPPRAPASTAARSARAAGRSADVREQPARGDHLARPSRARRRRRREPLRDVPDPAPLPEPAQRRAEQRDLPERSGTSPTTARTSVDLPDPLAPSSGDDLARLDGQVDAAQDRRGRRSDDRAA